MENYMSTEQNTEELSNSADIIQKEQDTLLVIPDGAAKLQRPQPKRRYGEKTITGIQVGNGDSKAIIRIADVKKLAELHLTYKDMAEYFGCKESTFKDNFHSVVIKSRQKTKQRLMLAMLETACTKHNAIMQIWLSKNLLGFMDQPINTDAVQVLPWNTDEPE